MELRKITYENVDAVTSMSVREDQRGFVAPNVASLAEAYVCVENGYAVKALVLYEEDEPVGFVMFGLGYMGWSAPPCAEGSYCIVRFMIDRERQGRGLGKRAMEVCLEYLGTRPLGPGDKVWLSYELENTVARELYHKFGFAENGEMCGEEIVAVRDL